MRRVEWAEQARSEFREILRFISNDNPYAGARVSKRIREAIRHIRYFPRNRAGRVEGTFEKVVTRTPYIIAYQVRRTAKGREQVYIVHIIHGARDWPQGQWPKGD